MPRPGVVLLQTGMTTPVRNFTIPVMVSNLEIETALSLEKFKEQMQLDGKAEETTIFYFV